MIQRIKHVCKLLDVGKCVERFYFWQKHLTGAVHLSHQLLKVLRKYPALSHPLTIILLHDQKLRPRLIENQCFNTNAIETIWYFHDLCILPFFLSPFYRNLKLMKVREAHG